MAKEQYASIRPSDFVEGGAVPVDKNLTWTKARFNIFTYPGTTVETTALGVSFKDEEGNEYEQQYSAADVKRWVPSDDGKRLVAVGDAKGLSKSSNAFLLIQAAVNAGFPENKIPEDGDVSVFDGLVAHHIAMPEPDRAGLKREAKPEQKYAKIVSIPDKIIKLPWEKKGAATGKGASKGAEDEGGGDDVAAAAIKYVKGVVKADGEITRKALANRIFKDLAKDPQKDDIAQFIYSTSFPAALLENGLVLKGDTIKAND